jgi:hypothetical protein
MADGAFYSNPRAWRVRIVQLPVWLATGLIAWLVLFAPPNPNDGPADRWVAWGGLLMMAACVLGVELFIRLYVLRMRIEGDDLVVSSLATVHHRTRRLKLADVTLGDVHREREDGVDNSWSGLSVAGQPLSLIVDTTPPAHLDREALWRALAAAGG